MRFTYKVREISKDDNNVEDIVDLGEAEIMEAMSLTQIAWLFGTILGATMSTWFFRRFGTWQPLVVGTLWLTISALLLAINPEMSASN